MIELGIPTAELLQARGEAQNRLHERAVEAGRRHFGRNVFVRGVIEISNFCRENCAYCGMRRDNRHLHRVRGKWEELAELIIHHRPASMTDVNLQAGEDPLAVREVALPLIEVLRRETRLGISVCLGTLSPELYRELRSAGARVYIMKFEMADEEAYRRMQAPGTLPERLRNIRLLARTGWHVSSGFIAGLPGQTVRDLVDNFRLAAELPLRGCSVSPFIPGDETPLADAPMSEVDLTLNSMAALRLMRPDWVIPAVSALNISAPGAGYRRGLRTGANMVTINLTPGNLRDDYVLYRRDRYIMTEDRILAAIEAEGLKPSAQSLVEYYEGRPVRKEESSGRFSV